MIGASALAFWFGAGLAQQDYFWPMLIAGGLTMLALSRLFRLPIDVILLGLTLFGYIAGNRGFAQISLLNRFPLLPAEFVLLVAGVTLLVKSAFSRMLPVRREILNVAILGWMCICGVRLAFDLQTFGFLALRDFATVYYAAFFFIAQSIAQGGRNRQWLHRCLIAGFCGMMVLHPLVEYFPGFFLDTLTVRGNPVIYFKGDLVGTMLVAGAILVFHRLEKRNLPLAVGASLIMTAVGLTTNNRASLVAVGSAMVLLLWGRRWRFAATQSIAGVVAVVGILFFAYLTNTSWRQTPLHGVYERVVSIVDVAGERHYSGEDTYYKGDNNRFRMVWWHAVVKETMDANPWFGLGFGADLASRFVSEYYPEQGEEFDTRSPHNVMLTLLGRAGLAGLLPLLLITSLITRRIYRAAHTHDPSLGTWCAAWVILISACFGVVLEGPMGAVVFWSALGLASAETQTAPVEISLDAPESLPNAGPSASV
ncbi:MAG: O-antigen ligase family protein [Cephaloticoccus sp.]|nr:O-antigen ligase family protein [Cephaloticoccus sp.]